MLCSDGPQDSLKRQFQCVAANSTVVTAKALDFAG